MAGFDWLLVDLEHGSGSEDALVGQALAAAAHDVPLFVRVESLERIRVGRVLDLGVAGVMIPRVADAAEAGRVARWARYPPEGERGMATYNRACGYGTRLGVLSTANATVTVSPADRDARGTRGGRGDRRHAGVDALSSGRSTCPTRSVSAATSRRPCFGRRSRVLPGGGRNGIVAGILARYREASRSLRSIGIRADRNWLGLHVSDGGCSPSGGRPRLMPEREPRYSAPAAGCAADVLLALARTGPATLPELVGRTGATRSLVYRVLAELERRQCVVRAHDGRFSLGVATIELGGAYARGVPFMESVRRALRELARGSGETASLGTLRDGEVLYLMREEGERSVFAVSGPGKLLPANSTALGKALLARRSDDAVVARFAADGELPRLTDRTIVAIDDLLADLAHARQRGWALEEGEAVRGRCCIGVAMACAAWGLDDLAIGLSMEQSRLREEGEDLVHLVVEAGARIEREVQARLAPTRRPIYRWWRFRSRSSTKADG